MAIFNRIVLFTAAFGCFVSVATGGFLFKKYSPEINYYYEFFKNPAEFSQQQFLNVADFSPEDSTLTQGKILFFLNLTEEMNEASQTVFLKNQQLRSENHFKDAEFLKKARRDAQERAFGVLRSRLNVAYMSLDEYRFIRNRVLAGLEIQEPKAFKKVRTFKNMAADVFNLEISQNSLKKIISETKKIQLLDTEMNLVDDFKSRIVPNLLPILAGFDEVNATFEIDKSRNDISLMN